MLASIDDVVEATTNSTIIIDGRDSNVYFGEEVDAFSGTYGHIPSAENIPVASFWNPDSTYIDLEQIKNEVIEIVGTDKQEVIVYCSVGGYGSVLQFILSELFDYKNIKLYDGSSQEWA